MPAPHDDRADDESTAVIDSTDATDATDDDRTGDSGPVRSRARGSMLALGMLGLDQVLGRKPREDAPIVVAANDDPVDIDRRGITVDVDDATSVVSPPQPRPDPFAPRRRRRKRA